MTEPDEGLEPEAESTTEEDPRIKKANQEAATYRRELRAVQAELKKAREAGQTEAEKAIAEAEKRGEAAARAASAARLVRAELRAAAAGRVSADALASFLEYVDPAKFLNEDGEPDEKSIEAAIAKLAPESRQASARAVPDLKSGALPGGSSAPFDGDAYIRAMARK